MLLIVSTGIFATQNVFTVDAAGDTMVKGGMQLGLSTDTSHGVNMTPQYDAALSIAGRDIAGNYAVKFYSGSVLVGGIRKK
jgi:hypothetical protein